jgi:hypothetical protein
MLQRQYHRDNQITGQIMDDELPQMFLVDHILLNRDMSCALAWEVDFPLFLTMDVNLRAALFQNLRSLFNSLPEHFDLQFVWTARHNADDVVERLAEADPTNSVLKTCQEEQIQFLKQRAEEGYVRRFVGYVFLIRQSPLKPADVTKRSVEKNNQEFLAKEHPTMLDKAAHFWRNLKTNYFDFAGSNSFHFLYQQEWEQTKKELYGQANSVEAALQQANLNPKIMVDTEVVDLLYYWWQPQSWENGLRPRNYQPGRIIPLTDYFIQTPFIWDRNTGYFEMDGMVHRILTVRTPPETISMVQFERILSDPRFKNMSMCTNILPYPTDKRIAQLTNELPLVRARVYKEPRLIPTLQQLEAEIVSLAEGNERCWQASHMVHIWGKTTDEVDDMARELKRRGLQADGLTLVQEEHALWEYWRSFQPGWTRDRDKYRLHIYNTTQLVGMLPIVGQPERLDVPLGVLFDTATGGIYNFLPHDQKNLNNYNIIMAGGSGTGKSFQAANIIIQLLRQGGRVLGIDLGGSYKSLCEAVNGTYVTMDIDMGNQTVNPLYIAPSQKVEASDIEKMLLFVEKMIVDPASGMKRLPRERMNTIEEALRQLITEKEGKEMFLRDLHALLSQANFDKDAAKALAAWVGTGRYAKLFDGKTQISFDNPFTIFDMSLVKDNKDVAPLMLMSIITYINQMATRYPRDPKLLMIDEAWFLLQDDIAGKFIAECFRTFRKTGTGILGISQGIEEWTTLTEKSAILNNTSTFILLRQNSPGAVDLAAQELRLTAQEKALLGSLATVPGEYSQSLLHQTRADGSVESMVLVYRPTPMTYAVATTNRNDRNKIEEIMLSEGLNHTQTLTEFARRYPKGTMHA